MNIELKSRNDLIKPSITGGLSFTLKREDELHPHISGNKFRKLKYNISAAKAEHRDTLLTFGGAFSNHIAATASAGAEFGFKTVGFIRGEELEAKIVENPTLAFARDCGMELNFITRAQYREKSNPEFLSELESTYPNAYILPEGGTNTLAIKGCEEILTAADAHFDYICVPVGTGGTMAGLINAAQAHQKVLGFPALKGGFLADELNRLSSGSNNWKLIHDYHFGGYGKIKPDLVTFINQFREETGIALDPVYTGKMCYGILDLMSKGYFKKGQNILAIHTGGLQGIQGMNKKLQRKGLPLIKDK